MTLEDAIEIKEECLRDNQPYDVPELEEADKLGIEALKRMKWLRASGRYAGLSPLEGETKE